LISCWHFADLSQKQIERMEIGLVFLHGFMEDARVWEGFASRFSKSSAIYCPDLPGHGQSPAFIEHPSMEAYALFLNAQLPDAGKFVFIGHSMGGYVAMAFAALFPNRVSGIVLMNSTCFADTDDRRAERNRSIEVIKQNYNLFARSFIPAIFAEAGNPAIDNATKMALQQNPDGMIQSTRAMQSRTSRCDSNVGQNFPVLLLAGRKDKLIPAAAIDAFKQHCPKAEVVWLERSGHIAFVEESNKCEQVLKDWMISKGFIR